MPETGATVVARASASRRSSAPARDGATAGPARVEPVVYLETMDGVDVAPPDDPAGSIELLPGTTYRLKVELHPAPDGTILIVGRTHFWVACEGAALRLPTDRYPVSPADVAETVPLEFLVEVPPTMPVVSGRLLLRHGQGLTVNARPLASIAIKGGYYGAPAGFQDTANVQLAPTPDPSLAVVHVTAEGDGLGVTAYHPRVEKLAAVLPQPQIGLADVADEKPSLAVYQTMDEYCRKHAGALIGWLLRVLDGAADDLSIVIAEHVDSRVPWEMLVLEKDKPLLGERVIVTRWTAVGQYAGARLLDPTSEAIHTGRVLAFVDDKGLGHMSEERRQLAECASEPCASLVELQRKLEALPGDVGLVFLACHGVFAKDAKHEVELKDVKNPSKSIRPLNLVGLPRPPQPPAIVINACHSARLVRTADGLSGFPEFFLGTFARSFLGTLGAVDDEAAGAVGTELVKAARRPGGVRIAEFLLHLRRRAAEEFKKDRRAWKYVSYFLYVFYGSPRDRLEIASRPAD